MELCTELIYAIVPIPFFSAFADLLSLYFNANLPPLHKRQAQLSLCLLYKIIHNHVLFPTHIFCWGDQVTC